MYIYIAIETKTREMEAKLFLSAVLAEAGHHVILGHKSTIEFLLPYMPAGVLFEKSCAITKKDLFEKAKKYHHSIAVHDEEGLVVLNPETYLKRRFSEESFGLIDAFLCWGETQKNTISAHVLNGHEKIKISGHPKFDLLLPEIREIYADKVKEIKKLYGDFFLINTRFGTNNSYLGRDEYLRRLQKSGLVPDKNDYIERVNYFDYHAKLFDHFIEMVSSLSQKFPEKKFIVRPHPGEDMSVWQEITKNMNNVFVNRDGNVYPWLLASSGVIHNGCTTGLEAIIAGKPALSYRPEKSDKYDIPLPNAVSIQIDTLGELYKAITDISNHLSFNEEQQDVVQRNLYTPLSGSLSSEEIRDVFSDISPDKKHPQKKHSYISIYARIFLYIKYALGKLVRKTYRNVKFPGLSVEESLSFLDEIKKVSSRFQAIDAKPFAPDCIEIYKQEQHKDKE